jgi:hypothetical protein
MARGAESEASATEAELRSQIEQVAGVERALLDGLLVEYAALAGFTAELRRTVEEQGPMVEVEKGGAGNRHSVMVENPALTAFSKSIGRQSDLARKIAKLAKDGDDGSDDGTLEEFEEL